jgi:hypothetical protein
MSSGLTGHGANVRLCPRSLTRTRAAGARLRQRKWSSGSTSFDSGSCNERSGNAYFGPRLLAGKIDNARFGAFNFLGSFASRLPLYGSSVFCALRTLSAVPMHAPLHLAFAGGVGRFACPSSPLPDKGAAPTSVLCRAAPTPIATCSLARSIATTTGHVRLEYGGERSALPLRESTEVGGAAPPTPPANCLKLRAVARIDPPPTQWRTRRKGLSVRGGLTDSVVR